MADLYTCLASIFHAIFPKDPVFWDQYCHPRQNEHVNAAERKHCCFTGDLSHKICNIG